MGKRRDSRAERKRNAQGKQGRNRKHRKGREGEPKPVIYRKPYHVNLGQSLAQLNGWAPSQDTGPGLRGRWGDAVNCPVGSLSVAQLELLLTQGADAHDLHHLWPVIFDHLRANICAAYGSGLLTLMAGRRSFWAQHPYAAAQLVELIEARQERLEADPHGLASLADDFADRYRAPEPTSRRARRRSSE